MNRIVSLWVLPIAAVVLVSGCAKKNSTNAATDSTVASSSSTSSNTTEANKASMKRFYDDVMNGHKVDEVDQLVTADFIDHDPGPGQEPGIPGLKKSFTQMYAAFPDMSATVDHYVAEGDIVTAIGTMSGTMKGDMGPMKATNKHFSTTFLDAVRFKDGKGVERWGAIDERKMMGDLGLMPPPPGHMADDHMPPPPGMAPTPAKPAEKKK